MQQREPDTSALHTACHGPCKTSRPAGNIFSRLHDAVEYLRSKSLTLNTGRGWHALRIASRVAGKYGQIGLEFKETEDG